MCFKVEGSARSTETNPWIDNGVKKITQQGSKNHQDRGDKQNGHHNRPIVRP